MLQYVSQKNSSALSSAVTTIFTDVVPSGHNVDVATVTAIDHTSDIGTSIEIGIMSGTAKIPVDITAGPHVAGMSHSINLPFSLSEGQRVYAVFNSATLGDKLQLNVFGKIHRRL